ncbi:hypothetical protein A2V82_05855 [candidate division KSB1 bacterium RBG_16_48_16]|nr:MAG: hypothetical protein A2V82_05855 [candidate division KSB1 bacterium RBG_16_48_16]
MLPAAAVGLLLLSFIGYFLHPRQFFYSYLTAFVFWLTIGLGALFLTMLHHLTGSVWSVVLRRVYENIMSVVPYFLILLIPVFFGIHELYHWSHKEAVAANAILAKKAAFLNPTFFILRSVLYFGVWYLISRLLCGFSLKQDQNKASAEAIKRVRATSAGGVILFALTITFAAFDWIMSLDAHWYSTIFGVYLFSGSTLAALAFITLLLIILRDKGILADKVTVEHYHDLGKLLFTFTVFWAYIAFSQYFLIWYANIPEETIWYQHRWIGGWKAVSLLLVFGHFVVPFFILMIRSNKRNFAVLAVMCVWLLFIHWIDIYWLVQPSLHQHGASFSWMDLTLFLGMGGLFVYLFMKKSAQYGLLPRNDPQMERSIRIKNY